uniref:NOP16 nucleolar protein n=1 Tax=Myotis myotis TaxID=51298 RepID=A0A7J7XIH9_MYOMY|nr:NOP16 nucleolar protein [Myotis myotis]
MPGTTPSPCGRTWPRWAWLWTPTRRCPSVRERSRPWRWTWTRDGSSYGSPMC